MILAEYSWLVSVGFFTTLGILAYVHSVLVASHGSVRNAAAAAQTELIKIVLEDYHEIKPNKSE